MKNFSQMSHPELERFCKEKESWTNAEIEAVMDVVAEKNYEIDALVNELKGDWVVHVWGNSELDDDIEALKERIGLEGWYFEHGEGFYCNARLLEEKLKKYGLYYDFGEGFSYRFEGNEGVNEGFCRISANRLFKENRGRGELIGYFDRIVFNNGVYLAERYQDEAVEIYDEFGEYMGFIEKLHQPIDHYDVFQCSISFIGIKADENRAYSFTKQHHRWYQEEETARPYPWEEGGEWGE